MGSENYLEWTLEDAKEHLKERRVRLEDPTGDEERFDAALDAAWAAGYQRKWRFETEAFFGLSTTKVEDRLWNLVVADSSLNCWFVCFVRGQLADRPAGLPATLPSWWDDALRRNAVTPCFFLELVA